MATYTQNHGYYNDGNSAYWSDVKHFDQYYGLTTLTHEYTAYGQIAVKPVYEQYTRLSHTMSGDESGTLRAILDPILSTAHKYPHRQTFQYFSTKHMRLIVGRFYKAIDYAKSLNVDDCGMDGLYLVIHMADCVYRIFADKQGFKVSTYPIDPEIDYRDIAECSMRELYEVKG